MLRRSRSFVLSLAPVLALLSVWLFDQMVGSAASEALNDALAAVLGVELARIAPFVLFLGVAIVLLWAAYAIGVRDRLDFEPRPDASVAEAYLSIMRNSRFAKTARHRGLLHQQAGRYESHLSDEEKFEHRLAARLDTEIHDRLRQGLIMSWGRVSRSSPEEVIAAERWADIELQFDRASLEAEPPVSCAYYRVQAGRSRIAYAQVRVCREQIEQQFPSAIFPRRQRRLIGTQPLADASI